MTTRNDAKDLEQRGREHDHYCHVSSLLMPNGSRVDVAAPALIPSMGRAVIEAWQAQIPSSSEDNRRSL